MSGDHRPLIDLRMVECTPSPVTASDIRRWFGVAGRGRVSQHELNEALACPPDDASPLDSRTESFLRQRARNNEPLAVDLAYRERQGGRRYLYQRPGSPAFRLVGRTPTEDRWHLQSIPRWIRSKAVYAPPGRTFVLGDMKCAFSSFLACIASDEAMKADFAASDFHKTVADGLGTSRPVGKVLNNSLVGLAGVRGLRKSLQDADARPEVLRSAKKLRDEWWRRYGSAAALRDRLKQTVREAAVQNQGVRVIALDGRTFTFAPAEVREVKLKNRRTCSYLTIFSSLLRSTEGVLLDQATRQIMCSSELGDQRLFLTMYDGLVLTVPKGRERNGIQVVRHALEEAGAFYGYPVRARSWCSDRWSE